jgi:hypothetical protein
MSHFNAGNINGQYSIRAHHICADRQLPSLVSILRVLLEDKASSLPISKADQEWQGISTPITGITLNQ